MICFFESVLLKEGERTLEKLTAFITSGGFVGSLVVIALTALVIMLLKKLKKSYISRDGVDGKRETNARFIFSIARYVVFLIAFITVLQINGVNVSALVTGLGIIVSFNIKVTRILDIDTGNFLTVSNRNISEMTVLSNWRDINIPAPYEQSAERMRKIMNEICAAAEKFEHVEKCEFLGTNNFGESSIDYLIRVYCPAEFFKQTRREILGAVQDIYAREGISVPYNQLDVHLDGRADRSI